MKISQRSNQNFGAYVKIVGHYKRFSDEQLSNLAEKAYNVGKSTDIIYIRLGNFRDKFRNITGIFGSDNELKLYNISQKYISKLHSEFEFNNPYEPIMRFIKDLEFKYSNNK